MIPLLAQMRSADCIEQVRFQGQTGRHLLSMSSSQLDPNGRRPAYAPVPVCLFKVGTMPVLSLEVEGARLETCPAIGDQQTPQFEDVTSAFDPDYLQTDSSGYLIQVPPVL